jgi:CheY-like chemotaxis protein
MTPSLPPKVLLVDDNFNARDALRLVLESQGLECLEVSNGQEALSCLKAKAVDLIVSDNQMPVMGGLDFIEQLHSNSDRTFPLPPIILLSGNLDDSSKTRAQQLGVFAALDKPCNFREFLSVVHLALER